MVRSIGCSYTSSVITTRFAATAISAMAASSVTLSTAPVSCAASCDQRPSSWGHRASQRVGVLGRSAAIGHQRCGHAVGAGHHATTGSRVVERLDQQHLRASSDQSEHR